MQRKQQLLSQLDNALKRKVQQKYLKTAREGQFLQQEFYGAEADKGKINPKQDQRNIYSKSPINYQKQLTNHPKSQHNINLRPSNYTKSPKLKSHRQTDNLPMEPSHINTDPSEDESGVLKLKQQIKRLKGRNLMLERELKQLKDSIMELENESRSLKREQSQYLSLKQENISLTKQISFMRLKNTENKVPKQNLGIDIGELQNWLKKILLQLNVSSIHKYDSVQNFVSQSLRSIHHGVARLSQEKNKIATKINNFDIQTLLLKQNNTVYRKELDVLRNENEQLQILIEQNCCKIEELEQSIQTEKGEKNQIQSKLKEVNKELDALKREFRMTVQASRHSKPKRQYSAKQTKQIPIQLSAVSINSIVKTFFDQQSQTDKLSQPTQNDEIRLELQQQVELLKKQIEVLTQNNLKNDIQKSKLQQKVCKYELYIQELEFQSQEIKKDMNNFMPQLKAMEEENAQLKEESSFKDKVIEQKQASLKLKNCQVQQIKDQLSNFQLQLKKEGFQKELLQTEIKKLNNLINSLKIRTEQQEKALIARQNELNNIFSSHNQRESQHSAKFEQFQRLLYEKDNSITMMTHEWNHKQREFLTQISKLEMTKCLADKLQSNITEWEAKIGKFKEAAKAKMGGLQKILQQTQKQLQVYKSKQQESEAIFKRDEQQSRQLIESYAQLETDFHSVQEQRQKEEEVHQALLLKVDSMSKQIFGYKCDIQRLSFDNKNNLQLKEYYQQVSNELKSKLQQLISQITKVESEKRELLERKVMAESCQQQIEMRQVQIQNDSEEKGRQCEELRKELHRLSEEYHLLSQEYARYRESSGLADRERLEQITLQNYDIERLVRESNEMRLRIDQLSSLRESNLYKSSQADQQITILTEENRSLACRNEQLSEELRMRQASCDEDHYLNELKNRQYCILVRKLLSGLVEMAGLEDCERFEELLEIGVERMNRKTMGGGGEEGRVDGNCEYGLQYEPAKRYFIGTEISSSQDFACGRRIENDEVLEVQSKIRKDQDYIAESPRSFKFSLSPFAEQTKEKRTSRMISYFNHESNRPEKGTERKEQNI